MLFVDIQTVQRQCNEKQLTTTNFKDEKIHQENETIFKRNIN